jgi:hypothetical protein
VGEATSAILGVVPPEEVIFPLPVTPVTHVAQEIAGAVPPELTIGDVPVTAVTVPLPTPQAPTMVINRPPVVAWTQLPEVRDVSVTLRAERLPEKVGAFVIEMFGVVPPLLARFPEAVTEVTPAEAHAAAVDVITPPAPACRQSPVVSPVPVTVAP